MKKGERGVTGTVGGKRFWPILALVCAALFWSGNFIIGRALRDHIDPVSLNYWRWLIALIILLPCGFSQMWRLREEIWKSWKNLVYLGFTGIAVFHLCVYLALLETTAINALIILSITPVVIVFSSWFFYKETISNRQKAGIMVSFIGAVILIARGNLDIFYHVQLNMGDLWMLVAVPVWAIYCLLLKHKPSGLPHLPQLIGSIIAGLTLMTPLYAINVFTGVYPSLFAGSIAGILYISIFASVLAFLCWNYGVAEIGPNTAGLFLHLMPVFGSILSIFFLREGIAAHHCIGGGFVLCGIYLTTGEKNKSDI